MTWLLLASPLIIWFNRHHVYDWWRLRDYQPPAAIVALADQTTLTEPARHDLYINHPQLLSDPTKFRASCPNAEQTIVLGCYISGEAGIYIYKISDARLAGIEQVTTAHETLHAAYERLSSKDRKYVDGLLQDYYDHGLQNPRVVEVIKNYQQSEPKDLLNEMHSVFGTEIASLPQPLEDYYKRYFANRQAVVTFSQQYDSEFTNRTNRIKEYDAQLATQKTTIDDLQKSLESQSAQIEAERARLDQLKNNDQVDEYNAGVSGLNARIVTYNTNVNRLRSLIATYNKLVAERNALAGELKQLQQAIDTRLTPQHSQ